MDNFNEIMALICMVTAMIMLCCKQAQYATYFIALAVYYKVDSLKQKQ